MKIVARPKRILSLAEAGRNAAGDRPLHGPALLRARIIGLGEGTDERAKGTRCGRWRERHISAYLRYAGLNLGEIEIDVHH